MGLKDLMNEDKDKQIFISLLNFQNFLTDFNSNLFSPAMTLSFCFFWKLQLHQNKIESNFPTQTSLINFSEVILTHICIFSRINFLINF